MWQQLNNDIQNGDTRSIARAISLVENETLGYEAFMKNLPVGSTPVIGITGPPGAGKSTLTDALIGKIVQQNKKVAIVCVDPSSPFKSGAILGDRIRMSEWYNHPNVYIRSMASRGALGGLHPKIIEVTDILKACPFDFIIIETIGVGQTEIEIAGLADTTVVVLVPEAGDEIQVMKAGLMEIADIFVVNKADRPNADLFMRNLQSMLAPGFNHQPHEIPVVKTIATQHQGIDELLEKIIANLGSASHVQKKYVLLAEKAWQMIVHKRMHTLDKAALMQELKIKSAEKNFNLYQFVETIQ